MKKNCLAFFFVFVIFGQILAQESNSKPYSNPVLIYGTSFGNFFKALYKSGNYNEMMKFTSSESIKIFGYDSILNYYKKMDFAYEMELRSIKQEGNSHVLNYIASINNTSRIMRLNVVIENDSCKIDLDNTLFNLGVDFKEMNRRYHLK